MQLLKISNFHPTFPFIPTFNINPTVHKIASNINLPLTCSFHISIPANPRLFPRLCFCNFSALFYITCQATVVSQALFLQFYCSVLHLQSTKHCFFPISVLETTFSRSSTSNLKLKKSNNKKEFQAKKECHLVW